MDMKQKREMRKKKREENIENNESCHKTNINWFPGHMAKTKREIGEKLPLVDLIYEVVDARMPISSRIIDLEELVKNKPRIIIMSKYDLCDKEITDEVIKQYESEGNKVVVNDLAGNGINQIIKHSKEIMEEENLKRKAKGMKPRNIRVLIVGSPNVGKSTLINRLVGRKATQIGDRPGVTKSLSWVRIHKDIELLDSPGILWPRMSNQEQAHILASFSSIKEEILDKEDLAIWVLKKLEELYPNGLKERYNLELPLSEDIVEVLDYIANKRGFYLSGREPDYERVYTTILNDMQDGRLGLITLDRISNN